MKTYSKTITGLFENKIVYEVPIYQRLYVWGEESHWQPLWDDMKRMAEMFLADIDPKIHFLGASVQQVASPPIRDVETHLVIDGQQRLTSLQILLKAFRDAIKEHNQEYYKKIDELIRNKDEKDDSRFKILSTITNRPDFNKVMECEGRKSLMERCGFSKEKEAELDMILAAYFFFHRSIYEWINEVEESLIDRKIKSLYKTVTENAKLAVIYIDESEDDAQLIFEKLNTGGKPLLDSDLVKNSLLLELQKNKKDAEQAYLDYWKYFDDNNNFWQKEIKAGPGANRATIDVYLKHVLTILRKKEVATRRIYKTYCDYVESGKAGSALERMKEFHKFGKIYERMQKKYGDPRVELFLERIHVMDGGAAHPFLLKLFYELKDMPEYLEQALNYLESFMVRRVVCKSENKGYNRFFVENLSILDEESENIPEKIREKLISKDSDTNKWPDDAEFKQAWINKPLYNQRGAARARLILEALEKEITEYPESDLLKNLTVEHIMPQNWDQRDWPLPEEKSPIEASVEREHLMHTVGNLTLLNASVNTKNFNHPWIDPDDPENEKRTIIGNHSGLILNKRLRTQYDDKWDEETIRDRSKKLFEIALKIWPRPEPLV